MREKIWVLGAENPGREISSMEATEKERPEA